MGVFSEPPDPIFLSKHASDLGEIIRELRAENERLRAALEAMHEEFAANHPDGERTAVDMARIALARMKD